MGGRCPFVQGQKAYKYAEFNHYDDDPIRSTRWVQLGFNLV